MPFCYRVTLAFFRFLFSGLGSRWSGADRFPFLDGRRDRSAGKAVLSEYRTFQFGGVDLYPNDPDALISWRGVE